MLEEFESTKPPAVLDYGKTKPLGYRAIQKLTRFFPLTALPNTDMVRFIINSNGYWDPYSAYIRVTVTVTNPQPYQPYNNGAQPLGAGNMIQLDNSAASLFQTLSIVQNGVEIERIDRYELLASILNDAFYTQEQRNQRLHEGFGVGMPDHLRPVVSANSSDILETSTTLPNLISASSYAERTVSAGSTKLTAANVSFTQSGQTAMSYDTCNLMTPSVYFDGSCEPTMWSATSNTACNRSTYTFCIPLISGIFGVLMPADEIKYIPMQFFQNMEMNLRLNPYAFHSCNPTIGTRNFQVTACELFVNIIHFAPEINSSLADIIKERGLYIHTCSYYYGPSHVIAAQASFETYPINMSFKSLRSILWCFIPSDYRSKSYVREIRRKALNLTAAQVRIGGELFPTFPIGNLGTSSSSGDPATNADFIANFYKSLGRLHDTVNDSLINSRSYCTGGATLGTCTSLDGNTINLYYNTPVMSGASAILGVVNWPNLIRGYTVSIPGNNLTFEPNASTPTLTGTNNLLIKDSTFCNFLENQIVPRAVFGIDLDTITTDDSVISGVNTLVNKPFELMLEGTNPSNEPCEINIFMLYDLVIMIDKDYTVKYLGRGG